MAAPTYDEVFGQARRLPPADQLRLLEALAALIRRESLAVVGREPAGAPGEEYDPASDPLMRLAGSITSGDPDWVDRHDAYLALAAMDPHREE